MESMITRTYRSVASFAVLAGLSILASSCQKVPLLAPGGSIITLIASVTALPINGSTDIIAQVIEPAGTPPQRGTLVSFTTTLGSIQPSQVETDISGRAIVKFLAGTGSGAATITAFSGGVSVAATSSLKILVGTAAVGIVRVTASPTLLPATGGASTIIAQALDINGNPLTSAPMTFSTTAGILDQGFATTDQNGTASTTLRTTSQATVTAAVGAQAGSSTGGGGTTTPPATGTTPTPAASGQASGTVIVNVSSAPTLLITPPSSPPGEGLPATFTIAVTAATTNGSAVREVTVNWGDGPPQSLGVVTGNAVVSHIYATAGTYRIVATVTDTFGNVVSTSTSVTVIPVALPTVNITASVPVTPNPLGQNVTFTIQVTPPTGVSIRNASINFGDGTPTENLGGLSGTITKTHRYTAPSGSSFNITVAVEDTLGRTTTGTTSITLP
jgi:PKD domain-containing protein